jgi:hypothetical protein
VNRVTTDLLAVLIARSGLSSIFAEKTLTRALSKAGVDAHSMTPHDLARALPEIERALATYMDTREVVDRMKVIAQLASTSAHPRA